MRKILTVCAIALCLVLLMACTKKNAVGGTQAPTPVSSADSAQNAASPSPGTVVIAESSNAVSDKEKQEVLDNLSKEIDDAFNAAKNLNDLDSSDLDTNNIQ